MFTRDDDSRRIMMALKENKLEHFYRIICAFGCTNYMEVVEDVEDVAFGIIIHLKENMDLKTSFSLEHQKQTVMLILSSFVKKCLVLKLAVGTLIL